MNVFDCSSGVLYEVEGTVKCDVCGTEATGVSRVRFTTLRKANTKRVDVNGVGRLFREAKYVTRPEGACDCDDAVVWVTCDSIAAEGIL